MSFDKPADKASQPEIEAFSELKWLLRGNGLFTILYSL